MKGIKVLSYLLWAVVFSFSLLFSVSAQVDRWGWFGDDPDRILDNVSAQVSQGADNAQDTPLNRISRNEGGYAGRYTLTNTLDSFRQRIAPYIQRAAYIGLSIAVILLIYNGFLMVTGSVHGNGDRSVVQKRLLYIVLWVLLLTWFYFIIELLVIIVTAISRQ